MQARVHEPVIPESQQPTTGRSPNHIKPVEDRHQQLGKPDFPVADGILQLGPHVGTDERDHRNPKQKDAQQKVEPLNFHDDGELLRRRKMFGLGWGVRRKKR